MRARFASDAQHVVTASMDRTAKIFSTSELIRVAQLLAK
jgi:hypothetical protein